MFIVYTKNNCQQCTVAKSLLKSEDIYFEEKNIEEDMDAMQYISQTGVRSMPQISKNGSLIPNGLAGLQRMWREGSLK